MTFSYNLRHIASFIRQNSREKIVDNQGLSRLSFLADSCIFLTLQASFMIPELTP